MVMRSRSVNESLSSSCRGASTKGVAAGSADPISPSLTCRRPRTISCYDIAHRLSKGQTTGSTSETSAPPLSEAVFQVLLALADGARHGYGVMQEVEQRTGGRVHLGPGTVYGAIKRLRARGLVEETDAVSAPEDDERRRYYRLTEAGRRVAVAEARRLERLLEAARQKDLLPREGPA
jgi:DNA-binding PadR family transcriptional regulator